MYEFSVLDEVKVESHVRPGGTPVICWQLALKQNIISAVLTSSREAESLLLLLRHRRHLMSANRELHN